MVRFHVISHFGNDGRFLGWKLIGFLPLDAVLHVYPLYEMAEYAAWCMELASDITPTSTKHITAMPHTFYRGSAQILTRSHFGHRQFCRVARQSHLEPELTKTAIADQRPLSTDAQGA
jgi:hypothetical protein